MNWLRNLAVLAVALLLTNSADAAAKGKKKAKPIKASVVEIKKDSDKESGSLTVKVGGPTKKNPNATATEKTFKITESTKIEKFEGKKAKKGTTGTAAKVGDIAKDGNLVLVAKGEEVSEIKILAGKKKKKAK